MTDFDWRHNNYIRVDKLKRDNLKAFWNGEPVDSNFQIKKNVSIKTFSNPKGIEVSGYGDVFFNGEAVGFLDAKTKEQFKKSFKGKATILVVNPASDVYKLFLTGGFYHYNPHRIHPDCVFAIKLN